MPHSDLIARINPDALRHNIGVIRRAVGPETRVCVPVKANGYGHGVDLVLAVLAEAGVPMVSTATLDEALEVRALGWARGILLFGSMICPAQRADRCERVRAALTARIALSPTTASELRDLDQAAVGLRTSAGVHVNVETGMGRLGLNADDAIELCRLADRLQNVSLEGVYTHLATADEADLTYVREQLTRFEGFLAELKAADVKPACVHAANSAAALRMPEARYDMVRPGLATYGYRPAEVLPDHVTLRPILRLTSRITLIKTLPKGAGIGYGRTHVTARRTRLAVVPIGYNDGYVRALSNRAVMTVEGETAPVVGRISMDQTTLDVTDIPQAHVGSEVIIINDRPDRPNSVEGLAKLLDTIAYEVTCLLGNRVERTLTNDRST